MIMSRVFDLGELDIARDIAFLRHGVEPEVFRFHEQLRAHRLLYADLDADQFATLLELQAAGVIP